MREYNTQAKPRKRADTDSEVGSSPYFDGARAEQHPNAIKVVPPVLNQFVSTTLMQCPCRCKAPTARVGGRV